LESWIDLLEGVTDRENLERARKEEEEGNDPADFLLGERILPPKALLSALSRHYRLPAVNLDRYHPSSEALSLLPEEVARRFLVLPLFQLKDQLYLAVRNPDDFTTVDYIRQLTGLSIEIVIAPRRSIESAINREYIPREKAEKAAEPEKGKKPDEVEVKDLRFEDEKSPIIKTVDHIISRGLQMGASDIHLEPYERRVSLRYRIDGILHEFPPPALDMYPGVVARIKIISNMDIAEKRKPQDGRTKVTSNNRDYDLRVSILPSLKGEGVVMRILDTSGEKKKLEDLGFSPEMLRQYVKLISKPFGLILVTGPTGSGKSTTLYATLKQILTPEKKYITLEDPVEYDQEGIHQVQVNDDIGFTFAEGLRSILRHDPDVVMLGEIRDEKSAEIAIRAAMTGHMVFSTLHTNDAPSAVTRLIDMGVQSYLVFSSLTAIMAQRLLRRLCPECRREAPLDAAQLESLGLKAAPGDAKIYEPTGCSICNGLGYKGRIAVYELLEITPAMRTLSRERCSPDNIRDLAKGTAFVTLRDSAMEKLFKGLTSVEEVLRLTID
jgi:type IV pilus assembly protein PilB